MAKTKASASALLTGVMIGYNNHTKSGVILTDISSDPNQPNYFVMGAHLPKGFTFNDEEFTIQSMQDKTVKFKKPAKGQKFADAPEITKTVKVPVYAKDSSGKIVTKQTKVSFHVNDKGQAINVTIL